MVRGRRVPLELPAQLRHVGVHRPGLHVPRAAPHLLEERHPGGHRPLPPQQREQQFVGLRGECGQLAIDRHCAPGRVHHHPAEPDRRHRHVPRAAAAAAQQGPHPLQQFQQPHGLGDVLVGVEPEATHLVPFLAPRAHDDHWHLTATGAQRLQHLEASPARQHEVQQHQVRRPAGGELQSFVTVRRHPHCVPLPGQVVPHPLGQVGVVLHQEDARPAHPLPPLPPASGRVTENSAPPPGADPTATAPPIRLARSCTTARPMPLPPTAAVVAPPPRT